MRLLQFTDTHLTGSPGAVVRGVATAATFARCLVHAQRRHPQPDGLLLTGDLVHDDPGGYPLLRGHFSSTVIPVYCLPGNHDSAAAMRRELAGPPFVHQLANRCGDWLVLMLDSSVPGVHQGHLSADELARADQALKSHPDSHALVCLHHHPVAHGSRWLDRYMLDNPGELFALLERHPGVRGLLWGHAHQPLDEARGTVRLMGTPSTCMQFATGADEFLVDSRPPAYRWLQLASNGGLETGIEWVAGDD